MRHQAAGEEHRKARRVIDAAVDFRTGGWNLCSIGMHSPVILLFRS
ncbi:hypothetical protein HPL003_19430 [Paenibacillus terrae HPL-003]|uniref:Uncharacterized protein n=1 Tax=Paenibacillus terrae (strain HPL-003) TaxID=985665 RepID=G7W2X0_PAETH|nr:hypothetical protein HPL003_19430 [Paenibacillus terrae HPL-003]